MKALIKLTRAYGGDIWVNPDYIVTIANGDSCTHLWVANDTEPVFIRESPEEIISLIKSIEE